MSSATGDGIRGEWLRARAEQQGAVVEHLRLAVGQAIDATDACAAWTAVQRQCRRYLRSWPAAAVPGTSEGHVARLATIADEADEAIRSYGTEVQAAGRLAAGLRVAVVGKGGAGKTFISGTLARLLARQGRRVLAADLDSNPGLAFSFGFGSPDGASLAAPALEEHPAAAYGWQLSGGLAPATVVNRYAVPAADGVKMLSLGKIDGPEKQGPRRTVAATLQVLRGFGDAGWDVIGDLEAGLTTPFERYHDFADHVLVIVGPEWRSALAARRLLGLIGDGIRVSIVANRHDKHDTVDHRGLTPRWRVPLDPSVAEAERLGVAPLDHCPGSPALQALDSVMTSLLEDLAGHDQYQEVTT
ncbi:MAG TPA: hypothetical protein VM142_07240 [Acidimicrobiales bacterium]|nr:hypothetical protein [Acidimicrobiales bacterium]